MAHGSAEVTEQGSRSARHMLASHRAWRDANYDGPCPVKELLARVGDAWTVLVVLRLGEGPLRFRALLRAVQGISQRMLTVTLRALERDGLVARRVFDTKPPAVEYRLTRLGHSLMDRLVPLTDWAIANDAVVKRCRAQFDAGERSPVRAGMP